LKIERNKLIPWAIAVLVIALVLLADTFIGGTLFAKNWYNSYALQAEAWLSGNLGLAENYPWLELVLLDDKVFVSFPPTPAVVMLPFVALSKFCGLPLNDHLIGLAVFCIAIYFCFKLAESFGLSQIKACFFALFATIGGNILHIVFYAGWVWFFAQILGFTFTVASFFFARKPSKMFLPPLLLALAVGCRPFQLIYAPVVAFLMFDSYGIKLLPFAKKLALSLIPAAACILFYMILNAARFGNPFEFGHNYLPEHVNSGDSYGQFNIAFFADNVKNLMRLPYFEEGFLKFHKFSGSAFYIVNPIFISCLIGFIVYVVKLIRHEQNINAFIIIPILIMLHLFLLCLHRTMGGVHFGNRYTIDAVPAAFLGILFAVAPSAEKTKQSRLNAFLIAVSIPLCAAGFIINLCGTLTFSYS
jgi:hypothetical protein